MILAAALLALSCLSQPAVAVEIEASVVDAKGKPIKGAVVFVDSDSPAKATDPPVEVDQIDKEIVPKLVVVPVGTKIRFPNKDKIHHHLYSFSPAKAFEIDLYRGEPPGPVVFDKPGVVKLACNIHDWMEGVIVVVPSPWFAVTDRKGVARIVAPLEGPVDVMVYHEDLPRADPQLKKRLVPANGKATVRWELALGPHHKKFRPSDYP